MTPAAAPRGSTDDKTEPSPGLGVANETDRSTGTGTETNRSTGAGTGAGDDSPGEVTDPSPGTGHNSTDGEAGSARGLGDELPEGPAKRQAVRSMFDAIAGRYELVNRAMTLGLDRGWRRRTVRGLGLPAGSVVLDCACGTGDLCRRLAACGHLPVGLDFSAGMLSAARGSAPLVRADIADLPVPDGAADGAVCGFALRNLVEIGPFLAELARAVRPGGRIALLEVGRPAGGWWGRGHRLYFERIVPRIGGLLSDADAYRYLPRSLAYLPSADELSADIAAAGFDEVACRPLSRGLAQLFTATRRRP